MNAPDFSLLKDSYLYAPATKEKEFVHSSPWVPPINDLLNAGYSFTARHFTDEGYLFRGIETGMFRYIMEGIFHHFHGSREECRVERIMNIYFITHELSDALTVSGLKHGNTEGGILVFPTSLFNEAFSKKTAAVLAIGDSGMVFHYPFITNKLLIHDLSRLIVTDSLAEKLLGKRPELHDLLLPVQTDEAGTCESVIKQMLDNHDISPASLKPAETVPRLDKIA